MIPKLVMAIRETRRDPEDPLAQLELINVCMDFVQPCEQLLRSSKSMSPTVSDAALQSALEGSVQQLTTALHELKQCLSKSEQICRHLDQDGAIERVRRLRLEAEEMERSARDVSVDSWPAVHSNGCSPLSFLSQGHLRPLPGADVEESGQQLAQAVRTVNASSSQLCKASLSLENSAGRVSRDMASGLTELVGATRCLAARLDDEPAAQAAMAHDCGAALGSAHELLLESKRQIATRAALTSPQEEAERLRDAQALQAMAKALADALEICLAQLPGQREAAEGLKVVQSRLGELDVDRVVYAPQAEAGKTYGQLQSEFSSAAVALNQVGMNLKFEIQFFLISEAENDLACY